ncbi:hypothetical protein L6164_001558 [Bauhinia variegata]|uniref:Uncharacterized protein n=1 Tax=Bauhinia variegata TaxID=167791 RepID=A0ACB9QA22_BAUVA|nr:hypothetical protein L6164_001558 [Bauhinia variegata]
MNPEYTLFDSVTPINTTNNTAYYKVCLPIPPNVDSDGIWGAHVLAASPMKSSFPVFELQVVIIFIVTQLCHFLFKRLGLPFFLSQMMAGLILGPSIPLGPLDKFKMMLFPYGSQDTLATLTSVGFSIFIFLYAVQMDFTIIIRTGRKAWLIAFMGMVVPLAVCCATAAIFSHKLKEVFGDEFGDLHPVYATQITNSFAVIASLLTDLKILNSGLGRLAMSSALVSDMMSITIRSITQSIEENLHHKKEAFLVLGFLFVFSILIPLIFRPLMFWVIKNTPEGRPVREIYVYALIVLMFGLGVVSREIGQSFVLGPIILGLAVPEGPPLGSALVEKLELFGTWFLFPIFITTSMMKVDLTLKFSFSSVSVVIAFLHLAHVVKLLACMVTAICCKMPIRDAFIIALILNFKGVVEVVLFTVLYDQKYIHSQTYAIMMLSIMILASFLQTAIRYLYDPSRKYTCYQNRNVMNLKHSMELRILACTHKPHDITPTIEVLKLCHPMEESPITVHALDLIELVGRSSPIFITHGIQKQVASSTYQSYSEEVILAFDLFKHENPGAISAHTYTAISPTNLMHEDICHLAMDKHASIIILPFHRRWSIDGQIEYEDKKVRTLNCIVLERAPCSVGILVSHASHPVSKLAVIFLTGKDDREALCLAKRAARDPLVHLTVYHLVSEYETRATNELMLDNAVLEDVKLAEHSTALNVTYTQIEVKDGPQTASILHAMEGKHDFFMVGRRHDTDIPQISGLVDWNDFPEMGVIGDFLASPDFDSKASVLVVQQQEAACK